MLHIPAFLGRFLQRMQLTGFMILIKIPKFYVDGLLEALGRGGLYNNQINNEFLGGYDV